MAAALALLAAFCIATAPTAAHHDPNGHGTPQDDGNGVGHDKHPGTGEEPPPPPPPPGEDPPPPPPPPNGETPPPPPATSEIASTGGSQAAANPDSGPAPAIAGADIPPSSVEAGASDIQGAALPEAGRSEVVDPVRGHVLFRLPGSRTFVRLPDARNLPNGTEIDAHGGVAEIYVSDGNGGFDTVLAWAGRFTMDNRSTTEAGPTGSRTITDLRLSDRLHCSGAVTAARARSSAKRSHSRRLWAKTKRGRFRTRGRLASATVRGTRWVTKDTCATPGLRTTVAVEEGIVAVENLLSHEVTPVPAGQHLTVRRPDRG